MSVAILLRVRYNRFISEANTKLQGESTMNKTELITVMAETSGLSKKDCDAALAAFIATIETALKSGDKVQLIGFGSFEVKERAAVHGVIGLVGPGAADGLISVLPQMRADRPPQLAVILDHEYLEHRASLPSCL